MPPPELDEVVGLQHHIVELEEAQRLLALEPQPHAVERQHAVDREMPSDVAQERDVAQPVEPGRVVDHDGGVGHIAEIEEAIEDPPDAGDVAGDVGVAQQPAAVILAGGVADLGGAAAHQHDRPMAGLLQPAQQHDSDQAADVQAVGRGIEADIAADHARRETLVERLEVGALMQEAAGDDVREEGRALVGHVVTRCPCPAGGLGGAGGVM